ncbi:hypothetical protein [Chryseobacterium koreense]|uniref:hypothetical protein n=1 Tax=Chryseobacterium koreense TaxID=232216 RepID=UPI00161EF3D5|nr:hypothetical protein [Chryseobacterium koreense]MBB5334417.1 hypothetical protein [Chryseobacterium koreense]
MNSWQINFYRNFSAKLAESARTTSGKKLKEFPQISQIAQMNNVKAEYYSWIHGDFLSMSICVICVICGNIFLSRNRRFDEVNGRMNF